MQAFIKEVDSGSSKRDKISTQRGIKNMRIVTAQVTERSARSSNRQGRPQEDPSPYRIINTQPSLDNTSGHSASRDILVAKGSLVQET